MKQWLMAFVIALNVSVVCAQAAILENGYIVQQQAISYPNPIYSVDRVEVVSTDPDPSGFQVLRAFIDVTTNGNLCLADSLAFELIQIGSANDPYNHYEIQLRAVQKMDVLDPVVACSLEGKITKVRVPMVVNAGFSTTQKFIAKYIIYVDGQRDFVQITASFDSNGWNVVSRGLQRNRPEVEALVNIYNSVAKDVPTIMGWEEDDNASAYGLEASKVLLVKLSDLSTCRAVVWNDPRTMTTRFLGDPPPSHESWYNEEYRVMTLSCNSGRTYKLMKKVRPKDIFDRLNPGPNQGEESYIIMMNEAASKGLLEK